MFVQGLKALKPRAIFSFSFFSFFSFFPFVFILEKVVSLAGLVGKFDAPLLDAVIEAAGLGKTVLLPRT
jgi:hypothetical protein